VGGGIRENSRDFRCIPFAWKVSKVRNLAGIPIGNRNWHKHTKRHTLALQRDLKATCESVLGESQKNSSHGISKLIQVIIPWIRSTSNNMQKFNNFEAACVFVVRIARD